MVYSIVYACVRYGTSMVMCGCAWYCVIVYHFCVVSFMHDMQYGV